MGSDLSYLSLLQYEPLQAEKHPCNHALVLLRYGFELALTWKVPGIESNPVKEIKNLKDDNKIERFLTQDQTVSLLAAVRQSESEMLQQIVLFLIYIGARKREVLVPSGKTSTGTKSLGTFPKPSRENQTCAFV